MAINYYPDITVTYEFHDYALSTRFMKIGTPILQQNKYDKQILIIFKQKYKTLGYLNRKNIYLFSLAKYFHILMFSKNI